MVATVVCPLCHQRKARRACPALGRQICAVCCGTKRQVEIDCPADCTYLASAREHPPAVAIRRRQDDVSTMVRMTQDLNERQSHLCFFLLAFLARYEPPDLHPLADEDIAEAAAALAATSETASRGVIYEHRPAAAAAARLAAGLTAVLKDARGAGGTPFERDAAVVLRRLEDAARETIRVSPGGRVFVDLIGRVIRSTPDDGGQAAAAPEEGPRLIIP